MSYQSWWSGIFCSMRRCMLLITTFSCFSAVINEDTRFVKVQCFRGSASSCSSYVFARWQRCFINYRLRSTRRNSTDPTKSGIRHGTFPMCVNSHPDKILCIIQQSGCKGVPKLWRPIHCLFRSVKVQSLAVLEVVNVSNCFQ